MALLLAAIPSGLFAQENILDRIESANASVMTIEAHFDQTKTLPASGKNLKSEGTLYYNAKDRMALIYDVPESDMFIIDGAKMSMSRGGRKNVFDTSKNVLMGNLSSTLLNCITGRIRALAQANDADVTAEETKEGYLVTATARKKAARGYSSIVLLYDLETCVLSSMKMVEFSQISTLYELSSIKTGVKIDPSVYIFSER